MINYEYTPDWPRILDHPYRILIFGGSESQKTNTLLNLIKQQNDDDYNTIDKIYLYIKDPNQAKCWCLIKKHEEIGLEKHEDPKALIEYSNNMQDVNKNIEEYNSDRKRKVLIVFDDIITDTINNKKLNLIVTKLFIRDGKLNIYLYFITQSYIAVPEDDRKFKQTRVSINCI